MKLPNSVTKRHLEIDDLDDAIVNLSAKINASTYELLVLIREFDERAGWLKWGSLNCTDWLHWRCDLSKSAAREKVRVAHALKDLSNISTAFSHGVLSYSKVRALTRVATPLNETSLLDFAMTTTAARVEERCRQLRHVLPSSIDQALSKAMHDHPQGGIDTNGAEYQNESLAAQQADAWVRVAKDYLQGNATSRVSSADAYQVVVHVDQSALSEGKGRADLPIDTVKRLTCDGSVISMIENARGEPLNVGRKQRTIPTAISRALWSRDKGCVFPGCTHTRFVDAHHIEHWAHGGETSLDNLLLLCTQHHQLVHEGGYEICTDFQGDWYFKRDDGRAIPRFGYLPADMIDDGTDKFDHATAPHASAEGFEVAGKLFAMDEVGETRPQYLLS